MQKVVDLLERHVQWLALGLGVVWLLYMTYSYVIIPPAQVTIGGTNLTAGEVDDFAVANAVKPLEAEMQPKEPPPMDVPSYANAWLQKMAWADATPVDTTGMIASQPPHPDSIFRPGPVDLPDGRQPPQTPVEMVAVPQPLPKPLPADYRFGRSTVIQPPPAPPLPQPGQPAPPPPQVQPVAMEADRDWVTHSFKISVPEIAALFAKYKIPPQVHKTIFLKVEMVRQELMPDEQWGNETVIKPLNNGVLRQPWPGQKATKGLELAYYNWAVQNAGDILQPAFYQTVVNKGAVWTRPGPKGEPQQIQAGFDPAMWKGGKEGLTDEQWQLVLKARRERPKPQPQQRARPTPRGRRGTGEETMDDSATYGPRDPDRPRFHQVRPPYYPPGQQPEVMDDSATMEEMEPGMEQQQQFIPALGQPGIDYPAGEFDPAAWGVNPPGAPAGAIPPQPPEIEVWAHDETVQPGKTYRYKMRYYIKNPLWQQPALVKNRADADVFAIQSPDSDWGPNVEVPPLTNFFIAGGMLNRQRVRFEVFTWKGGVQHNTVVEAGPGDMVGRADDRANFSTGYTVVDIRPDARQRDLTLVYLTTEKGETVVRNPRADNINPLYKKLKEEAKAAQATAAAAAAQ